MSSPGCAGCVFPQLKLQAYIGLVEFTYAVDITSTDLCYNRTGLLGLLLVQLQITSEVLPFAHDTDYRYILPFLLRFEVGNYNVQWSSPVLLTSDCYLHWAIGSRDPPFRSVSGAMSQSSRKARNWRTFSLIKMCSMHRSSTGMKNIQLSQQKDILYLDD